MKGNNLGITTQTLWKVQERKTCVCGLGLNFIKCAVKPLDLSMGSGHSKYLKDPYDILEEMYGIFYTRGYYLGFNSNEYDVVDKIVTDEYTQGFHDGIQSRRLVEKELNGVNIK